MDIRITEWLVYSISCVRPLISFEARFHTDWKAVDSQAPVGHYIYITSTVYNSQLCHVEQGSKRSVTVFGRYSITSTL